MWLNRKMKYRSLCLDKLKQMGYNNPVIYLDNIGNEYNSYWGDGDRRAEVVYDPKTSRLWVSELVFKG